MYKVLQVYDKGSIHLNLGVLEATLSDAKMLTTVILGVLWGFSQLGDPDLDSDILYSALCKAARKMGP